MLSNSFPPALLIRFPSLLWVIQHLGLGREALRACPALAALRAFESAMSSLVEEMPSAPRLPPSWIFTYSVTCWAKWQQKPWPGWGRPWRKRWVGGLGEPWMQSQWAKASNVHRDASAGACEPNSFFAVCSLEMVMAEFSHHRGVMVADQPQALPRVLVVLVVQSKRFNGNTRNLKQGQWRLICRSVSSWCSYGEVSGILGPFPVLFWTICSALKLLASPSSLCVPFIRIQHLAHFFGSLTFLSSVAQDDYFHCLIMLQVTMCVEGIFPPSSGLVLVAERLSRMATCATYSCVWPLQLPQLVVRLVGLFMKFWSLLGSKLLIGRAIGLRTASLPTWCFTLFLWR